GLALLAVLSYFKTDFFSNHPIVPTIMVLVIVVLAVLAHASAFKGAEMTAFVASGLSLVSVVVVLFQ
ncbi:cytochrome d ubiquinol oxidase, subunit II, partial [Streptococcus agalactiae COH1]